MTFVVTTAIDNGDNNNPTSGSLRQAILQANANTGFTNTIDFAIAINGSLQTIQPPKALPQIFNPVIIDGYSEPGASPNSNVTGALNSHILIQLDGSLTSNQIGFEIASGAAGSVVRGLAIFNWLRGILVQDSGVAVTGDFLGVLADGQTAAPNGYAGVDCYVGGGTIGGNGPDARNLISGNEGAGVILTGTSGEQVQGNLIGTDSSGTVSVANAAGVVIFLGASANTLGGTTATAGNVISGNTNDGVSITTGPLPAGPTTQNVVEGNLIGTDVTGTVALANGGNGVEINGIPPNLGSSSVNANVIGGTVTGAGNQISGNGQAGVLLYGSGTTGNMVEGNLIGTDPSGNVRLPNLHTGVKIRGGASGNIVGGPGLPHPPSAVALPPGAGNLISGNNDSGVQIVDTGTTNNLVQGNLIGTNLAGTAIVANFNDGVQIAFGASGNTVGGLPPNPSASTAGVGNVISGNSLYGVWMTTGATGNVVEVNLIGTDRSGSLALGNLRGVQVSFGANGNTVGGTTAGAGNVISGNRTVGVGMDESATQGNSVQGNLIGTTASGTVALPNSDGVVITNTASNNLVGGTATGAANVISGNKNAGVKLAGNANGNVVQGNRIGTNSSGMTALANTDGVVIADGASNNTVGGTASGAGNLISGNTANGVVLQGSATMINALEGNLIGTDPSSMVALPNKASGVSISAGASFNLVGGTLSGAGNVVSGNGANGIVIAGTGTGNNMIEGNWIGTDSTGELGVGNTSYGVVLGSGASRNQIGLAGGTTPQSGGGNLISANGKAGIEITGASDLNTVGGNYIGTDEKGTAFLPNQTDGVLILNGTNDQIGGPGGVGPGGKGNLISGNGRDGVRIFGELNSGDFVVGNLMGTDDSGANPLGNTENGVFVLAGSHGNIIGTTLGNVIAFNLEGVVIGGSASDAGSIHNTIQSNSIFNNTLLGIDLGFNGVTPNSNPSPHVGPNEFQNFPVILQALASSSSTTIVAGLSSIPNTSFTIQFFANVTPDPTGFGEGQVLIATAPLTTNAAGVGAIKVTVAANLAGQYISATATDLMGDTSEFGKDLVVMQAMGAMAMPVGNSSVLTSPAVSVAVAETSGPARVEADPNLVEAFSPLIGGNLERSLGATQTPLARSSPAMRPALRNAQDLDVFFTAWARR
jgi:titin